MRTTLNLDETLIEELLEATEAKTKTEAIHIAISELIRRQKLERLKSLSGKIRIGWDGRKREKAEIEHQQLKKRWYGHR